jgi:hypothetical protein
MVALQQQQQSVTYLKLQATNIQILSMISAVDYQFNGPSSNLRAKYNFVSSL